MKPHLQSYLHKGQFYFQIVSGVVFVIGGVSLKFLFHYYQLPDFVYKITLISTFAIFFFLVLLQAYLHQRYVSSGISPVAWLTEELKNALASLKMESLNEKDIRDLEQKLHAILGLLKNEGVSHQELNSLLGTLKQIMVLVNNYWEVASRNEILAATNLLAKQVAHDIKGPLTSIEIVARSLEQAEPKTSKSSDLSNLLTLSVHRLNGIAEELLKKRSEKKDETIENFSLHQMLDELIGEYQGLEDYSGIIFKKNYALDAIYLTGDGTKLQRAFGNVIKNAIEALNGCGTISIATGVKDDFATILIEDNGRGMPPEKLKKVMAGGYTEGKQEGHGIGMTVVLDAVAKLGGKLSVDSEIGHGTQFTFKFPVSTSFKKFAIQVFENQPIVIIDDDPTLLNQWDLQLKTLNRETILFQSYEEFEKRGNRAPGLKTAIVDYYLNGGLNGVEILRRLKSQGFTYLYLCTVDYWKPSLQKMAKEFGILLCPKPLPPIELMVNGGGRKTGYKVLVIDDDEGIRLSWNCLQEKLHIEQLYVYPNLEALIAEQVNLKTIDIAFVDKNIRASQYSGAEVIAYLKSRGVTKVVLASGESEKALRQDPALAQVDFISGDKIPASFRPFFS